jgi:hypothetical protein
VERFSTPYKTDNMKWVNLAERQPDYPLHKFIVRVIGTNSHILSINPNRYKTEWEQLVLMGREDDYVWKLDELEWLDESEEVVTEPYGGNECFVDRNVKLKSMWQMDDSLKKGFTYSLAEKQAFNSDIQFMIDYYHHNYLYWKNKQQIDHKILSPVEREFMVAPGGIAKYIIMNLKQRKP